VTSDTPAAGVDKESKIQTILIVEDDDAIGDFLTRFLEQETSCKVIYVTDATQALEVVASIKPNLFILDYRLPGINGLELYDRLHAMKELETVPALMISANSPGQKAVKERQITFIPKPFELDLLIKSIEKIFAQQED